MAEIIDFKTRTVTPDDKPDSKLPAVGVPLLACECVSTQFELRNGGAIICARCRHQVNAKWDWVKTDA